MDSPEGRTPFEFDDKQRLMNEAMARAVRRALLQHKRAGNPIAVWQDGQVVWIPPEEIPVEDLQDPLAVD
jgi:hypothetical protein